ncbi:hypothetical protein Lal_00024961 [Lupinus albus]|uniref:Putative TIR domain-containing protein n=1 Tax=Lupinus albus TaxID=3870 RepID=A0A6A4PUZ7_LUPAL|nr:putative TIR domain-containing protein [Lupinus albus]KAF1889634.1 hypothetical protein Lal_00024961 [Lupinus albus]
MAWSSSSNTTPPWSSPSTNTNPPEKHEVFISFRSEDTRKTFTSHLNAALKRLDIRTYIDNNLERGDEISDTLIRAIEEAKISIIVFSKNYAASKWCLDELLKIVECGKTKMQIIVPVFYDIDPSDVRNQRGTYAEAFNKHEWSFQHNMEVTSKWRDGLVNAANLSGWDCSVNRTELEIVEEIAMDVLQKLNRVDVADLDHEIKKYEQLAELQHQYFETMPSFESCRNHQATVQRITQLKMERNLRLLRLTPQMLSHMGNSTTNTYNYFS